ncbi:hypothetical protein TorRG33x02_160130 [Trema orientale]|uniref:RNase H type-1 domain-containing protein n=1 Tax=Trema orientale TaxID=63057 RepID=A0A2P5ERL3_TREOI|nr:hypothetical protein TorRG33x02_160130 [Trema orientale]
MPMTQPAQMIERNGVRKIRSVLERASLLGDIDSDLILNFRDKLVFFIANHCAADIELRFVVLWTIWNNREKFTHCETGWSQESFFLGYWRLAEIDLVLFIHNSYGKVMMAASACGLNLAADIELAKARAILEGLELAKELGLGHLMIHSDCSNMVRLISGNLLSAADMSFRVLDVREDLVSVSCMVLSFGIVIRWLSPQDC